MSVTPGGGGLKTFQDGPSQDIVSTDLELYDVGKGTWGCSSLQVFRGGLSPDDPSPPMWSTQTLDGIEGRSSGRGPRLSGTPSNREEIVTQLLTPHRV